MQRFHWWITGSLFLVALGLYILGFSFGAVVLAFCGFVVESLAYLSILLHPRHEQRKSEDR